MGPLASLFGGIKALEGDTLAKMIGLLPIGLTAAGLIRDPGMAFLAGAAGGLLPKLLKQMPQAAMTNAMPYFPGLSMDRPYGLGLLVPDQNGFGLRMPSYYAQFGWPWMP